MTETELLNLKYPIGKFKSPDLIDENSIVKFSDELELLPSLFEKEAKAIIENKKLDVAYRPQGWTARQVIHHLADSHMNAYIRFKLTLTEDHPVIKPYKEDLWAGLADSTTLDPVVSLELIKGIHARLVYLMRSTPYSDFSRSYFHPESQKDFTLKTAASLYVWHGKHHLGHLRIINS